MENLHVLILSVTPLSSRSGNDFIEILELLLHVSREYNDFVDKDEEIFLFEAIDGEFQSTLKYCWCIGER